LGYNKLTSEWLIARHKPWITRRKRFSQATNVSTLRFTENDGCEIIAALNNLHSMTALKNIQYSFKTNVSLFYDRIQILQRLTLREKIINWPFLMNLITH